MSTTSPTNIIIIGASAAGANLARSLEKSLPATHRIVLIEARDLAFWPPAALRAAVVPAFEDKVVLPLDKNFFPSSSKHIFVPRTRVVTLGADFVEVDHAVEPFGSTRIPYDYAVLATGSSYPFPARPVEGTREDVLASFRTMQTEVKAAKSILIVGGGAVGVEFAGEVRAAHPDKKIALISSGAQLIGSQYSSGLHNKLYSQLTSSGTKVILNESVDISGLSTGPIPSHTFKTSATATEIEADYLLNATGTKPDASLLSAADASAVDECGAARVDANLRVRSEMLRNVFAVGDATGAGSIMAAKPQTTALSASLLALVNAPKDKAEQVQLKEYKAPAVMIVVPLGPKGGASQLPWFSLGGWFTSMVKGKTLFVDMFKATYKSA